MKFKNPLLVVSDMEKSKQFYWDTLGLRVTMDFGSNVTLTGGICLQTKDSWAGFVSVPEEEIRMGGNDTEIYFEEDNFDGFAEKLGKMENIRYVHPIIESLWGQRAVRIYDPDMHIIEIGENIKMVCRRFLDSGMSVEQVMKRMDVPEKFVNACKR